jgi:hypothetical protein
MTPDSDPGEAARREKRLRPAASGAAADWASWRAAAESSGNAPAAAAFAAAVGDSFLQ